MLIVTCVDYTQEREESSNGVHGAVVPVTMCFCSSTLTFVISKEDCIIADSMAKLSK
jgi:hypothetical protein